MEVFVKVGGAGTSTRRKRTACDRCLRWEHGSIRCGRKGGRSCGARRREWGYGWGWYIRELDVCREPGMAGRDLMFPKCHLCRRLNAYLVDSLEQRH